MEQNKTTENYWDKVRSFNTERTNFLVSLGWQLIETIIPFILIWIFVGADFQTSSFNHYQDLNPNPAGMLAVICVAYLVWAWGIQTLTFFLKWQKADTFTFTFVFSLLFLTIIMNGCWLVNVKLNTGVKIIIRFLICLFVVIFALLIGVLITNLFRNLQYKIEEEDELLLQAYTKGEMVPSKAQVRIHRAEKNRLEKEKEQAELKRFEEELNQKLIASYNQNKKQRQEDVKEQRKQEKFDQKENKKRNKFNKKHKKNNQ